MFCVSYFGLGSITYISTSSSSVMMMIYIRENATLTLAQRRI